jgi:hypothetical protein
VYFSSNPHALGPNSFFQLRLGEELQRAAAQLCDHLPVATEHAVWESLHDELTIGLMLDRPP